MPVLQYRVSIERFFVRPEADVWGEAHWMLDLQLDGAPMRNRDEPIEVGSGAWFELPQDTCSRVFDVSTRRLSIGLTCEVKDSGFPFSETNDFNDVLKASLGTVRATFRHPFALEGPIELVGRDPVTREPTFTLAIRVQIERMLATTTLRGAQRVAVSRSARSGTRFTTVTGTALTPRVEVCPVVPVPAAPTKLPTRPPMPGGLVAGAARPIAGVPALSASSPLNLLANPSFIPYLAPGDRQMNAKAAKIAVTYVAPGNLDVAMLCWKVKEGPVRIVGSKMGPQILARATNNTGAPRMSVLEVRWLNESGPVLATFRAWAGKVKQVKYRANRIVGTGAVNNPLLTVDNVRNMMRIVNVIFWQGGIHFIPDTNTTCYEGATTTTRDGVYNVPVTNAGWTTNVAVFAPSIASRLNFRPGVINIAIVRSTINSAGWAQAWASDIQGVNGANETLAGTPSTSWRAPSGVPQDAAATSVTMRTFTSSNRPGNPAPGEPAFITARHGVDAAFTAAAMGRLYACVIPSNWGSPAYSTDAAVNLAHELGHVLGLRHRGSGASGSAPLSDDGVNCADNTGTQRGHPWNENVMTYGYGGGASPARALDIDLIQTPVIRRHPSAT